MNRSTLEILPIDPRLPEVTQLIAALSQELAQRYDFEEDGFSDFQPEQVLVPRSAFLVGRLNDQLVACGALRPMEDTVVEVKRMYVIPECRGRGYSKLILHELERLAFEMGYTIARLETGERQPEAIRLYEKSGYRRIPNYGIYVDWESSRCFEKQLDENSNERS